MTTAEAREELRRRCEGYLTDSVGAAREWLESGDDDVTELLEEAGLDGTPARKVLTDLTGVSV